MTPAFTAIASAAPAVAMLGVFACLIGGGAMVARPKGDTKKGVLLMVMAAVLLGNVVIWTM